MVYDEVNSRTLHLEKNTAIYTSGLHAKCPWTQIIYNGNFENISGWYENAAMNVFEVNNNVLTMDGGGWRGLYQFNLPYFVFGHKYLISLEYQSTVELAVGLGNAGNSHIVQTTASATNTMTRLNFLVNLPSSDWGAGDHHFFAVFRHNGGTASFKNINVFDLTAMFGSGNEPASADAAKAFLPFQYYATNY